MAHHMELIAGIGEDLRGELGELKPDANLVLIGR